MEDESWRRKGDPDGAAAASRRTNLSRPVARSLTRSTEALPAIPVGYGEGSDGSRGGGGRGRGRRNPELGEAERKTLSV